MGVPAAYADDTPGVTQQVTTPPVSVADLAGVGLLAPDVIAQLPPDLVAAPDLIVIAEVPEWWNKFGVLVDLARVLVIQVNVFLGGRGLPTIPVPPQVPTEQVQPTVEDPTNLPPGGPPGGEPPPEPPPVNVEGAPPIVAPEPGRTIEVPIEPPVMDVPIVQAPTPPVATEVSAVIVPPAPAAAPVRAYDYTAFLIDLRCGYYPSEGQWSFGDAQRRSDCGALDHVRQLLTEPQSICLPDPQAGEDLTWTAEWANRAAEWASTIRDDGIRLSTQGQVARVREERVLSANVCRDARRRPQLSSTPDAVPDGYGTDAYINNIAALMNRPPAAGVNPLAVLAPLLLLPVGGPALPLASFG